MEYPLLRSLLNKNFYDDIRGNACPVDLFTKDLRKVKSLIDQSMES